MKDCLIFLLVLFILNESINSLRNNLEKPIEEYLKINPIHLKKYLLKQNVYVVDIRDNTISSEGYLENSLLIPLTKSYEKWFPVIGKEGSSVILICDEDNYKDAINKTISFGRYNLLGYVIYDEIPKQSRFNIKKVVYNENELKLVKELVEAEQYIVDIREIDEYKETGVIKEAHLIPLSTFKKDISKLPKDKDIYFYCKSGVRALLGMTYAQRAGYRNKLIIMRGGMTKTIEEQYPLVPYSEQ